MSFRFLGLFLLFSLLTIPALDAQQLRGEASYYADKFHGRPTSTGEKYDKRALTAANRDFPVGSVLRVTRLDNGRSVDVRINDCLPDRKGRIIDLSRAAAEQLGMIQDGVVQVELKLVKLGNQGFACNRSSQDDRTFDARGIPTVYDEASSATRIPVVSYEETRSPATIATAPVQYWVQFGAYRNLENARSQYINISESGLENLQIVKDNTFHRLMAGPYSDKFSAEAMQYYLEREKQLKGVVKAF